MFTPASRSSSHGCVCFLSNATRYVCVFVTYAYISLTPRGPSCVCLLLLRLFAIAHHAYTQRPTIGPYLRSADLSSPLRHCRLTVQPAPADPAIESRPRAVARSALALLLVWQPRSLPDADYLLSKPWRLALAHRSALSCARTVASCASRSRSRPPTTSAGARSLRRLTTRRSHWLPPKRCTLASGSPSRRSSRRHSSTKCSICPTNCSRRTPSGCQPYPAPCGYMCRMHLRRVARPFCRSRLEHRWKTMRECAIPRGML